VVAATLATTSDDQSTPTSSELASSVNGIRWIATMTTNIMEIALRLRLGVFLE
jgi:hypothetical protein